MMDSKGFETTDTKSTGFHATGQQETKIFYTCIALYHTLCEILIIKGGRRGWGFKKNFTKAKTIIKKTITKFSIGEYVNLQKRGKRK